MNQDSSSKEQQLNQKNNNEPRKYFGIKIEGTRIINDGFIEEFEILPFYEINEYLDYCFSNYHGEKENFFIFIENSLDEYALMYKASIEENKSEAEDIQRFCVNSYDKLIVITKICKNWIERKKNKLSQNTIESIDSSSTKEMLSLQDNQEIVKFPPSPKDYPTLLKVPRESLFLLFYMLNQHKVFNSSTDKQYIEICFQVLTGYSRKQFHKYIGSQNIEIEINEPVHYNTLIGILKKIITDLDQKRKSIPPKIP